MDLPARLAVQGIREAYEAVDVGRDDGVYVRRLLLDGDLHEPGEVRHEACPRRSRRPP